VTAATADDPAEHAPSSTRGVALCGAKRANGLLLASAAEHVTCRRCQRIGLWELGDQARARQLRLELAPAKPLAQPIRAAAEAAGTKFRDDVRAFVLKYLRERGPTSAEVLTLAAKEAGILPPRDDRAFGGIYLGLARRGRIVKAGTVRRTRGHGTTGGNIWRLPP
jgi:hypothetical protein